MNDLTRLGVAAARGGDKVRARSLLKEAISSNDKDLVAWWWLAQVVDDATVRHKYLEKARTIAAENETGSQTYKQLLEQSEASLLPRYNVADRSRSSGDHCPICSVNIAAGDEIVACPKCGRGNHSECWEDNVFHCGNFACDGSGLVDRAHPAVVETAAKAQPIKVEEADIPEDTPYASRETQEQGFMYRLQERMLQQVLLQAAEKDLQERQRKERIEELRKQLMQRTTKAMAAGLVLGVCLAVPAFRSSGSWLLALVTIYLAASGMRAAAAYSFMDRKQITSMLYWVLPQVIATLLMWATFNFWRVSGSSAVISVVAVLIIGRILKTRPFLERRDFIAFSGWLLLGLTLIRVLA